MPGSPRPAVFLDRDGTINEEVDYLTDPDQLRLYPGSGAAIGRLNAAGYVVVVATNQSGIARGFLNESRLAKIHASLQQMVAAEGGRLDLILFCPHHPEEGRPPYRQACRCRKPLAGMFEEAALLLGLDLSRSWTVGDSLRDLVAGHTAGTRTVLVQTGKGASELGRLRHEGGADPELVPDLPAAVELILEADSPGSVDSPGATGS